VGAAALTDVARIELRPGVDWDDVRRAIGDWASATSAVIRMDRPLRDADGRHYHLAAPAIGTGTLEVNAIRNAEGGQAYLEVVCRPHWAGTWAGRSMLDLVETLAESVGRPT
jgi:hypothetical protein